MANIVTLIPAAGASRRMRGEDKLLQDIDGVPLLRRQVLVALEATDHVCVTLPDYDHPRTAALKGLGVQIVAVPDAATGMSASLRRGVAFLPAQTDAIIVLPADMPDITSDDLRILINGFRSEMHPTLQQGCSADGVPGHPVLFPKDCMPALMSLEGDRGGRVVVEANRHRLRRINLPGNRALVDLDTPEDWAAWRRKTAELV